MSYTATVVAVDARRQVFVVQVDGTVEMVTLRTLNVESVHEGMRLQGPFEESGRMRLEVQGGGGVSFEAFAESGWSTRAANVALKV